MYVGVCGWIVAFGCCVLETECLYNLRSTYNYNIIHDYRYAVTSNPTTIPGSILSYIGPSGGLTLYNILP